MIELQHVVKRFGDLVAVNDLSLTVNKGEFFAILGPNAAGKTTTIRILTGLIKPTAGSARVAGYDVQEQPLEVRKRMAYVPEGFAQGYQTLEDDAEVLYHMSHEYVPDAARGVRWDDPAFGIEWPAAEDRIISERDLSWPLQASRPTASSRSAARRTTV